MRRRVRPPGTAMTSQFKLALYFRRDHHLLYSFQFKHAVFHNKIYLNNSTTKKNRSFTVTKKKKKKHHPVKNPPTIIFSNLTEALVETFGTQQRTLLQKKEASTPPTILHMSRYKR